MSFNLWNHKPWWCQPWSILLTGITIITSSWWLFTNLFLTLFVSTLILFWWVYFLILYPRLVAQIIESETKNTIK